MTKKVISAILALTMLFMTACGQADSSDDIKETTSITTVEQTQTEDTSSDSEPVGSTADETTTTTTASETSEKEEKTSSQTEQTEGTATTTTKTSEGNADTTTTTTPAATTTTKATTRATTYKPVQTTKATTRATTQATQKPVVTTTTKATTKPVTTTTKTTTAKPSSDKVVFQKVRVNPNNDMKYYIIETKSMYDKASADANKIVTMVNNLRKANGLNTVKVNPLLTKAAKIRARELAETYIMWGTLVTHTRPNGEHADSAADDVGYMGCMHENALGSDDNWSNNTPIRLYTAWYNSEGHRKNMLNKEHTIVGIAVCHITIKNEYMMSGEEFTFAIQLFD